MYSPNGKWSIQTIAVSYKKLRLTSKSMATLAGQEMSNYALLPPRVFLQHRHHSCIWLTGTDPGRITPRKHARRHRDTRHDDEGAYERVDDGHVKDQQTPRGHPR